MKLKILQRPCELRDNEIQLYLISNLYIIYIVVIDRGPDKLRDCIFYANTCNKNASVVKP
jgi:hypothetical protein